MWQKHFAIPRRVQSYISQRRFAKCPEYEAISKGLLTGPSSLTKHIGSGLTKDQLTLDNDLFSRPKCCSDIMRMREEWGRGGLPQATLPCTFFSHAWIRTIEKFSSFQRLIALLGVNVILKLLLMKTS